KLAEEIFSVGSPLLTMKPAQAVSADCKIYEERGLSFSVSQIEELSFSHLPERQAALLDALEEYRQKNGLIFSTLLVTDVNTQNSILLLRGSARFEQLVDYPEMDAHTWQLDGIVSRKKQLLPYLTTLLGRLA
ncbi:MAG TPA: DHHA2 domain-containing protein, partial [Chthoniobacterales bacterium]